MLLQNKTNQIQAVDINSYLIKFLPGQVFSAEAYPQLKNMRHAFSPAQSMFDFLLENPKASVNVYREFALGDVIMTYTAVRWMARRFPYADFTFICPSKYADLLFFGCPEVYVKAGESIKKADYFIDMTASFERDHTDDRWARVHRFLIALHDFGVPKESMPVDGHKLPWQIHLGNDALVFADHWKKTNVLERPDSVWYTSGGSQIKRPCIALQVKGSGPMKSLPFDVVRRLALEISKTADVFLIDPDPVVKQRIPGNRTHQPFGITLRQLTAILRKCEAAIVMDSGPLWLAHLARIPIVAVLGPTFPEARISMAPLPLSTEYVETQKWIKCHPCREAAVECNKTFKCLSGISPQRLIDSVVDKLNLILYNNKIRNRSNQEDRVTAVIDSDNYEILEKVWEMSGSQSLSEAFLNEKSGVVLRRLGMKFDYEDGGFCYDKKGNSYKIFVDMTGRWARNGAGVDVMIDGDRDSFIPAVSVFAAVSFIKKFNLDQLNHLESINNELGNSDQMFALILGKAKDILLLARDKNTVSM